MHTCVHGNLSETKKGGCKISAGGGGWVGLALHFYFCCNSLCVLLELGIHSLSVTWGGVEARTRVSNDIFQPSQYDDSQSKQYFAWWFQRSSNSRAFNDIFQLSHGDSQEQYSNEKFQWNDGIFQWHIPMTYSNNIFQWHIPMTCSKWYIPIKCSNGIYQWDIPMKYSNEVF